MRTILILWIIPVVLFWGWYGLSANDMHYGMFFLSRAFHDHIFQLYSQILHMPADEIPVKLAWLFGIDTLIVFGIAALRWYKHWLPQSYAYIRGVLGFPTAEQRLEERVERVLNHHQDNEAEAVRISKADRSKDVVIGPAQPAE